MATSKQNICLATGVIAKFNKTNDSIAKLGLRLEEFIEWEEALEADAEMMEELNDGIDQMDDYTLQDLIAVKNKIVTAHTWIVNNS